MDNEASRLAPEQFAAYDAWTRAQARALWEADAVESVEVVVTHTFCAFDRRVEARMGSATLLLENI